MITPEDNNKDNAYERVKRWREKNRALYNLRQREYRRKKNITVDVPQSDGGNGIPSQITVRPVSQHTVESLRELIKREETRVPEPVEAVVKPLIFRNDYGAIISENAWNRLQEKRRQAKEGGYTLDEYSQ